ncbi:DUF1934 domain-containing protein [Sedimentibacter sp. MB31-C6]|uniref:DUF1934 domain-containing protein n=1 Tax=Sedimentibacter sp. MB31-C6 TaxID=3109366 RepID=UPI002DDD273B|nr:DUF1934 domain-containing protein [Sedimentibacter sp. MB36-C1]WSI05414.1 DUF1934 domain-containing protein [Sedimentibacter sp. MB36-C1]
MENVKIKIVTIQTIDDAGNEDTIELVTEAKIDKTDECFIIDYDESDITETKESKTRLKIYKDKMLMTKIGTFSSKMEFEKGKNFQNIYSTPYGTFDLNFSTLCYEYNLNNKGKGSVYVEYKMVFGKSSKNYNKLKIDIL